jgi:tetratricopeptide (TPR) repeat protein/predicted Ser/Thr protein kinase
MKRTLLAASILVAAILVPPPGRAWPPEGTVVQGDDSTAPGPNATGDSGDTASAKSKGGGLDLKHSILSANKGLTEDSQQFSDIRNSILDIIGSGGGGKSALVKYVSTYHGNPDDPIYKTVRSMAMDAANYITDPPKGGGLDKFKTQPSDIPGGQQLGTLSPEQLQSRAIENPIFRLGASAAEQKYKEDPGDPRNSRELGMIRFYQRRYDDAAAMLGKAYAAGDHSAAVERRYAGAALQLGDYATATEFAQMALAQEPDDRDALAVYHFSKDRAPTMRLPPVGDFPGAAGGGAPALASGAGATGAVRNAASPGNPAAVAAAAPAAGAAAPEAAQRSAEYARDAAGALKIHDLPTAYKLASQAIQADPRNAQALNYRAMALSQMRHYSDAVQDASAALALAPGNAAALYTRSWAFAKQGRYKEALQDADLSLETNPNNAFAYQTRAYAQAGLGDRAGAIDSLRRSAAIDPRFDGRLQRAVQLPQDADMTLLFSDGGAAARDAAPAPGPLTPAQKRERFLRLFALAASGGLLIALGTLNVVSASWRDRVRMTVRRALGGASPAAGEGEPAGIAQPSGAFWTQYQVAKEIGLGGMGVVYEAIDRSLERRVAVKRMRDEIRMDPADRARFINEARLVAQLHHPNIVDIYQIVEDEGEVYLVFEFVEGRTLQDQLKSGGPMELPRARKVLQEMSAAVAHAHEKGIIHRDLKPSNVMITPDGRVKVMDFGVARQAKDAMTRHSMTNTVVGTPPYMAPEQEQGTVRRESDVYALGVCLYEMTTGQLPFSGSGAGMLLNKLNGKLIPASQRAPGLPAGLDQVIAKALAPDPDKRYRTPAELMAALDALLSAAGPV